MNRGSALIRKLGPWLAAALMLTAASASAGAVSDVDRFELWNECRPLRLIVETLSDDATAIGLTEEAIGIAVRSRLRAARIYSDSRVETEWAFLYFLVQVVGPAVSIDVTYNKSVIDVATELQLTAASWRVSATGTHGGDSSVILSSVAGYTDQFIDEYFRVNTDACK